MNAQIITAAEFAARFPRARAQEGAETYVIVEHNPRQIAAAAELASNAAGAEVAQVGYTNASRSRTVSRFAVINK